MFEILKTTASERNFNPVQDYICKEKWDGTPRIETAIIDYLGAEDTPLIREQTKLWFVAAVARAFEPGCKFDNVLTLPGPQGIGKSTFFKVIGDRWFNDSFSFASGDKEKVETITNGWIIEISELNGMKRANDAEAAKAFLSRRSDCMRPAYGRKPIEYLRHNVFAATTNEIYWRVRSRFEYLPRHLGAFSLEVGKGNRVKAYNLIDELKTIPEEAMDKSKMFHQFHRGMSERHREKHQQKRRH